MLELILRLQLFTMGIFALFVRCSPLRWLPFARERLLFENKNRGKSCESWKQQGLEAHYTFEFSSEGELENVLPLIESLLENKTRIECIFCSPSAEKKMQALYHRYPHLIRFCRLPFFSSGVFINKLQNWVSAPCLVMSRYDFFPQLLLLKGQKILTSATLLTHGKALERGNLYWKAVYELFDHIFWSLKADADMAKGLLFGPKNFTLNLRALQVEKRLLQKGTLPQNLLSALQVTPKEQIFILGSFYAEDGKNLFSSRFFEFIRSQKISLLVFPHHTEGEKFQKVEEFLQTIAREQNLPYYHLNQEEKPLFEMGIYVITFRGILVESYGFAQRAYVGGGFSSQIHSVLEPFLASALVSHGPRWEKSVERLYVFESSPERIDEVKTADDFFHFFCEKLYAKEEKFKPVSVRGIEYFFKEVQN